MTQLVVILGPDTGSWPHVAQLIRQSSFDEVIIVTNEFGKQSFSLEVSYRIVTVDFSASSRVLRDDLVQKLKPLINDTEVGCNFISGAGNSHMALVSALLHLGLGIRFVTAGDSDFIEL